MNTTQHKSVAKVVLAGFFILQSFNGIAQTQKFKFGIAAGPSFNWLNIKTNGLEQQKNDIALNYGLYADFKLEGNEKYFISSGLMMQNYDFRLGYNGAVLNADGVKTASLVENSVSINYLEVPIGLKMRSDEIGYSHLAGWFGFGAGFRINSSQELLEYWNETGTEQSQKSEEADAKSITKGSKLNLKVGGEWERKITGETFFVLGITYENGLTNILKGASYEVDAKGNTDLTQISNSLERTGEDYKALPRSIVLHLGVYF